jgi:hypothetical protein
VGKRRGDNARESWWVTNNSKKTIAIGDLLLVPAIKPKKKVDLLHYYSREKISYSKVLVTLVKSRIVSLDKEKIYSNNYPGQITSVDVDEAITPAEENEIDDALRDELGDFIGKHVVTEVGDPGSDNNLVTEQGIRESLLDEITEGQEITEDTTGAILYGKDPDDEAAPVGISGEENNEILTMDLDVSTVLEEIYVELIKANIQMAIITGNEIKNNEIHIPT